VKSIRSLGFRQPVYLIPNGVHTNPAPEKQPESLKKIKSPFILFLSRVHPKKGVDLLLKSWSELKEQFPTWTLVIAGPDLEGYRAVLEVEHPESSRISWTGPVTGDTKDWLLSHASLLCLPTHSENFGIVIAEALAHQTPVLTTTQTPWKSLVERKCGWFIPPEQQALTTSLQAALAIEPDELKEMGARGRIWMEKDFNWNAIAESMRQAYEHLLGTGPAPDFLITA